MPLKQGWHALLDLAPSSVKVYEPSLQLLHAVSPVLEEYVPVLQTLESPRVLQYDPDAHV